MGSVVAHIAIAPATGCTPGTSAAPRIPQSSTTRTTPAFTTTSPTT
jgi:hypothetical protein